MIFSTLAEREAIFNTISERKNFDDLHADQQSFIDGMYEAISCLEAVNGDYLIDTVLHKMEAEVKGEAISEAIDNIEVTIAEYVVAFRGDNYMSEKVEAETEEVE